MRRFVITLIARWLGRRAEFERLAGRYAEAEALAARALALAERATPHDDPLRVVLLNALGVIHKSQGRLDTAARAYLQARRVLRRRGNADALALATLDHNLGGLEHARGRFARGEPFARRAVAVRERVLGPGHPDVARDVAALAAILDGLGRHAEAEALHRRALAVFERRGRRERREVASVLGNLAACVHEAGRATEAEPLARRARAMTKRLLGPNHPDVALASSNLAVILKATPGPSRFG